MGPSAAKLGSAAGRRGRLRWVVCPVPRAGFAFAVLCALTALLAGLGYPEVPAINRLKIALI